MKSCSTRASSRGSGQRRHTDPGVEAQGRAYILAAQARPVEARNSETWIWVITRSCIRPGVRPSRVVPEEVLRHRGRSERGGDGADRRRQAPDLRGPRARGRRRGGGQRDRRARGRAVRRRHSRAGEGYAPSSSPCRSRRAARRSSTSSTASTSGHIERFDPDFSKVLVRYNPDGDADVNARQVARLRELSEWLHSNDRSSSSSSWCRPRTYSSSR